LCECEQRIVSPEKLAAVTSQDIVSLSLPML